ncbi:hypothetical protein UlMin_007881, partial [Ulmus minor]
MGKKILENKLGKKIFAKKIRARKILRRSIWSAVNSEVARYRIRKREGLERIGKISTSPLPQFTPDTIRIESVTAMLIFDTRFNPTIEVNVRMVCGHGLFASVPSGAPPGSKLWQEVREAIDFVNTIISPALKGKDPKQQAVIDKIMVQKLEEIRNQNGSGTLKFGASAIFAVSLAVCKAAGFIQDLPLYGRIATLAGIKKLILPVPVWNVINVGSHPENKLSMRELTILPIGASSFEDAIRINWEIYSCLMDLIWRKYREIAHKGYEGGFAPKIQNVKEGLELLKKAISRLGHTEKVVIGVDAAASEFYGLDKSYHPNFTGENNGCSQRVSGDALNDFYNTLVNDYSIASIEDPFDKDDWESYSKLTAEIGQKVQILGDEFLVTDPKRIKQAINEKTCNTLLLKVKHLRSVTETIKAVKMVKQAGWGVIVASHGSGETDDTFVGQLAVGVGACQIKAGASCNSERESIYIELRAIECIERNVCGDVYAGPAFDTLLPE